MVARTTGHDENVITQSSPVSHDFDDFALDIDDTLVEASSLRLSLPQRWRPDVGLRSSVSPPPCFFTCRCSKWYRTASMPTG